MKITRNEKHRTENEKKTQQRESQNTEIVNGVHPLHWATSPGPSPMGTDPILVSKWYINGWNQLQQL
jgi:hypothetical protein